MSERRVFRRNIFTGVLEEAVVEDFTQRSAPRSRVHQTYTEARPLVSIAGGCHPSQAKAFNEIAKREGRAGVHYDETTGEATFASRAARNAELKRRNLLDGDAGYGDWAGT